MSTTRSIIRYTDRDGNRLPGGQCRCCGTGPGDGTLIYLASVCDIDGVFYSMLCGYCFDMIIDENNNRPQTERDTMAKVELTRFLRERRNSAFFASFQSISIFSGKTCQGSLPLRR